MLKIEFTTGNAAFMDTELEAWNREMRKLETVRILKEIIKNINNDLEYGLCMDINGNKVGEWTLS